MLGQNIERPWTELLAVALALVVAGTIVASSARWTLPRLLVALAAGPVPALAADDWLELVPPSADESDWQVQLRRGDGVFDLTATSFEDLATQLGID